tara:strand:- start:13246 stop:13905 length:660 start_codon:yes stop_codon:yes gene_type:complete
MSFDVEFYNFLKKSGDVELCRRAVLKPNTAFELPTDDYVLESWALILLDLKDVDKSREKNALKIRISESSTNTVISTELFKLKDDRRLYDRDFNYSQRDQAVIIKHLLEIFKFLNFEEEKVANGYYFNALKNKKIISNGDLYTTSEKHSKNYECTKALFKVILENAINKEMPKEGCFNNSNVLFSFYRKDREETRKLLKELKDSTPEELNDYMDLNFRN